ncbi:MAG: ThuA domain-containing protein [Planctomycetota bacterium]
MPLMLLKTIAVITFGCAPPLEPLGEYWGTGEAESKYYRLVDVPLPKELAIEAGSFEVMPDEETLAIATRRGDIFLAKGVFEEHPEPTFHRFAEGLDEIFGLAYRDGSFIATQQAEVSRITDVDGDGRADQFDTLSDVWGFGNYHEFAFGSKPDGTAIPICSGIRSPCGIGPNEHGVMFYAESQGPWNGSCSLKVLEPGGFMGHPISFPWYERAPEMGPVPVMPNTPSRLEVERQRVEQLVPYAVVFPYIRMGRSISGFQVDRTGGKFGPFANQIFIGDFSLGVVMRATTEKVNGVWQGACYPFREGFNTGLLAVQFTPDGNLIAGGTNRGWPVRGPKAYAIQRLDWTGVTPFEIKEIKAKPQGFGLTFTKPVDAKIATDTATYQLKTFTHIYRQAYGSPEVDQTTPVVTSAEVSKDGMRVLIEVDGRVQGHVHDFFLPEMRSLDQDPLLHANAYYTLNEIPQFVSTEEASASPSAESMPYLHFPGSEGPGKGKHIVLIAAEQEYRSEQAMPMLAKVLATHHGFDCTVLFSVNENGEVDPTLPAPWKDPNRRHNIAGLEKLAGADCLIWMSRFMHLPDEQMQQFHDYFDSGKPFIALRTANHGFQRGKPYVFEGRKVSLRELLGGAFSGHHGGWHRESTRGIIVEGQEQHPILTGVDVIWGTSDVYRCHTDRHPFPATCTPLVLGQPLVNLQPDAPPNPKKGPLPIAWTKTWTGNLGHPSRVFHFTMGSAEDFANEGVRRLTINAVYWGLEMESEIQGSRSIAIVGEYTPLKAGFNHDKLGVRPRLPDFYR